MIKFDSKRLCDDLCYKRNVNNLSLKKAALQIGIPIKSYQDMEQGRIYKIDKLLAALQWLNKPVNDYIYDND